MNIIGLIIGLFIFFMCLFLAGSVGTFFTSLNPDTLDILKSGLLFIGATSIVIGALSK